MPEWYYFRIVGAMETMVYRTDATELDVVRAVREVELVDAFDPMEEIIKILVSQGFYVELFPVNNITFEDLRDLHGEKN